MKKLTIEQKAAAYDEAIARVENIKTGKCETKFIFTEGLFEHIFPELKESEGEKIRQELIAMVKLSCTNGDDVDKKIAWLEKQGNPTDINPSEFDLRLNNLLKQFETLPKEELVSSLSFYLNVVQNNRTYKNEEKQGTSYTKKNIDNAYLKGVTDTKNEIEKQYEANYKIRKDIATFIFNYKGDIKDRAKWMDYLGINVFFVKKQSEQQDTNIQINPSEYINDMGGNGCYLKSTDKIEPKFKVGDIITNGKIIGKVDENENNKYHGWFGYDKDLSVHYADIPDVENWHLWTIQDAKDGDVICSGQIILLFKRWEDNNWNFVIAYAGIDISGKLQITDGHWLISNSSHPATKEQRDLLFQKMKEARYEWDAEKKELKKLEQKPAWSKEDEKIYQSIMDDTVQENQLDDKQTDWLKSLKDRIY